MLSDMVCIYTLIMYTFVSDFTSQNLNLAGLNVAPPSFPFPTANIPSQWPLQDFKITWDEKDLMELKSNSCLIYNGKYQDDFDTRDVLVKVVLTDRKSQSEIKKHNKFAGKSIVVDLVYAEKQETYTVMAFAHYKLDLTCLLKPNLTLQEVFDWIRKLIRLIKTGHIWGLIHGDITSDNLWVSECKQNLLLAGLAKAKEVGSTVSGYAMGTNPMLGDIQGMQRVIFHIMSCNPDSQNVADYYCCIDLLKMMQNEPGMNVREMEIMHPLFWDTRKRIDFIKEVNEVSNSSNETRMRKAIGHLQAHKNEVLGCADWVAEIKKIEEMQEIINVISVGGYDGQEISQLFRYWRNIFVHKYPKAVTVFRKHPKAVPINDWLIDLMLRPFPRLLVHTYRTINREYGKKFVSDFLELL